ncbi:MAG: Gfo/Idh/MocA family oxidoreductase [Victivallaceae bacterium]|nr:Gfo/Idh/MocA family oxidoreductase [Victivallaceae bacterium]
MKKTKIGIVGCGMISGAYFNAASRFRNIEVVACTDVFPERATAKAGEFHCRAVGYDELLADKEVEIVLNLTPPQQHSRVAMDSLRAGKHAYSEKPFGVDRADAAAVMELAARQNLRVGCAPDTFMGAGQQTARKLIDDHWIGEVLSGTAIVQGRGPEKWRQAPFFYDYGAGPMLDLGPYYITTLVNMLGPAKSVCAVAAKGSEYRTFGADIGESYRDKYKPFDRYPVNVNTHLAGVVEFVCGAVITVIASFDVWKHGHAPIEIYGSKGSLKVPDPNTFGGEIQLFRPGMSDWQSVPHAFGYAENSRSIGIADMADAISHDRKHRASGELANHVLEIMLAFDKSGAEGKKVMLATSCERPAPMAPDLEDGEIR